jgi:hypothetical protein
MLKNISELGSVLSKSEQKNIIGGITQATHCYVVIQYDDGYTYSAGQGTNVAGCRALVGNTYDGGSDGNFTVQYCFCTSVPQ